MNGIKVASGVTDIKADDSMAIAGGILPGYAKGQEGKLRASTVLVKKGEDEICIVSCDVLMAERDVLDDVEREIEKRYGIPFNNILIASTHTHHAPSPCKVHGYDKDERFVENLKDAVLSSVGVAKEKLERSEESRMHFWLSQEATVGQNSRLLLEDNTIYWVGSLEDAVRPTGPFDPELPVIAFKEDGKVKTVLFNHSTHNIGALDPTKRSPGFYGLAAQNLKEEMGGDVIFLPGAAGSTHDVASWFGHLTTEEKIIRIKNAIREGLSYAQEREVERILSIKEELEYKVREFDDEEEDKAVSYYCNKRIDNPKPTIEVFRKMRTELLLHQGESRKTYIQLILIGDVAFVGIPGEFFTKLGILIKRYSPFRYTYIIELANDWIGYIPDEEAYELGGYQVWTGFHSFVGKGTGEEIVNKAVGMLKRIKNE